MPLVCLAVYLVWTGSGLQQAALRLALLDPRRVLDRGYAWLTDADGRRMMDFHGNNVHQVGYRNPYVINRVKAQLDELPFSPRRYTNPVATACGLATLGLFEDVDAGPLEPSGGAIAVATGPLIGGLLTTYASWRKPSPIGRKSLCSSSH